MKLTFDAKSLPTIIEFRRPQGWRARSAYRNASIGGLVSQLRAIIDKTQGEYKESASPLIADMRADIDF